MKKKVMIVQRIFTHYRKAVFDLLALQKDILLLHSRNDSGIKQIKADYSKEVKGIQFGKKDTAVFLRLFTSIFKYKPGIIIHEFAIGIVSLFFVMILCKIMRIKLILWSHGYDRKKGFYPGMSTGDKIRLMYLKAADAVLLYGENDKQLLSEYIDPGKIFVAWNTFDTKALIDIKNALIEEGRDNVKKRLGFTHTYNLIYIGRLLPSKHPAMLIQIYEQLKESFNNDIGIHIVGDGPLYGELKEYCDTHNYRDNVFFHGAVFDDEMNGEMLFASDLMVLPGALGLSINHSFCFDIPVVSFEKGEKGPFHGPEVDYVVHGKTGYLAKNYDIENMTNLIYNYLKNVDLQVTIKRNIKDFMEHECTLDRMVNGMIRCIEYCEK